MVLFLIFCLSSGCTEISEKEELVEEEQADSSAEQQHPKKSIKPKKI